uniref:Centrosomal protein of 70 kDa n=1 Tax=Leptobrachium leishanense TaxID=445787 RepID=A0A8C5QX64_9ANUR
MENISLWESVNKLLWRHGCSMIHVTAAEGGEELPGSVLLNVQASLAVRSAVQTLISDTERRQNLIHNLITANEQLKQDVQLQQSRAARQEQKASELQQILDSVRTKIRDLEDDFINKTRRQRNEMRSAMREKQAALNLCQELRDKLRQQDETLSQLRTRLSESAAEERPAHHGKTFLRLMKRPQIPEVTDGYEQQINNLQGEIRYTATELPINGRTCSEESLDLDASPNYKALLKSYQEQMKERRENHEQLMRENSQIRAELATRPSVQELKLCKQQTRRLERILLQHKISFRGTNREQSEEQTASTAAQSLERLPASECRRYLQEACAQLHVKHVTDLAPAISSHAKLRQTLHRALRKLNEKLLPNLEETCESGDVPRVEELLLLVDTMLEDVDTRAQDPACVSSHTLRALVAHFQKLFDVPSVSGVYPRMNEVYSKLGETCNMMRNLQCVLGLDGKVTCGALVNAVWQLCRELEEGESQKLRRVLGTLDIDSVINKIQEHEEFFPAFEGLITELLDVLEVGRLEQVLPAVRRLMDRTPQ